VKIVQTDLFYAQTVSQRRMPFQGIRPSVRHRRDHAHRRWWRPRPKRGSPCRCLLDLRPPSSIRGPNGSRAPRFVIVSGRPPFRSPVRQTHERCRTSTCRFRRQNIDSEMVQRALPRYRFRLRCLSDGMQDCDGNLELTIEVEVPPDEFESNSVTDDRGSNTRCIGADHRCGAELDVGMASARSTSPYRSARGVIV
jgi:hypothetical protein